MGEWTPLDSGTEQTLRAVRFFDDRQGVVIGEQTTLRRTVDGGEAWAPVGLPSDVDLASGYSAVDFADADSGWLAKSKILLRTVNAGLEWHGWQDTSSPEILTIHSLIALSADTAWTAGGLDDPNDTDHCVSPTSSERMCPTLWRHSFEPPNTFHTDAFLIRGDYDAFLDLSFGDASTGYAVGTRGLIFRLDRADEEGPIDLHPQNTSVQPYLDAPSFTAVFAVDAQTAWVVGELGLIFHTEDGETWSEQDSHVRVDLHDVVFLDAEVGCAVGDHGTALFTQDGGDHWEPSATGVDEKLYAVAFPSADVGYAVGDHGTLLKWSRASDAP